MKKTPNFSFVTKIFLHYSKLRMKGYLKEYINGGDCFLWANLVYHLHPNIILCSAYDHAFIKYKNKFYDSDRPRGVKNWKNLPELKDINVKRCMGGEYKEFKTQRSFDIFWGFGYNHHNFILKTIGESNDNQS